MPTLKSRRLAIAVDMAGCPNRCRHCWLGNPPNRRLSEQALRRVVKEFREWERPGENEPFAKPLTVMTWYREPDFAPNYRHLWELEKELSDEGAAVRFELLSVWRLARDADYALWAREIGTEACQISFFGLEETTDYFTRRPGSFHDNLVATERLLEAGIRPRWQLFLTEYGIAELDGFVDLIRSLRLEERSREIGHDFEVFVNLPSPDGEAFSIEHLRPTADILAAVPDYLAEKTRRHYGAVSLEGCLGKAEREWLPELSAEDEPLAPYPDALTFMVTPDLDVFSNLGELMPWWRLGNLKMDGIRTVMRRFELDEVPGLYVSHHVPVSQLACTYGRPKSRQLYSREDLILRWLHQAFLTSG